MCRPSLASRLSGRWSGVSEHSETGDKTIWDNVDLTFSKCGNVTGSGTSFWKTQEIAFKVEDAVLDMKAFTLTMTKKHYGRFTNVLKYTLTLDPTSMSLSCPPPNPVILRRVSDLGVPIPDSITCKICMEKPMNCVFMPCSHYMCCTRCAQRVSRCPICRTDVTSNLPLFPS